MRTLLLAPLLLVACNSDKPTATVTAKTPPAAQSLFQTDRARACAQFADRVMPAMKNDKLPMDQTLAGDCMTKGRVTKANYDCLMAAGSADGIGECFASKAGASAAFEKNKAASCAAYAKHVIDLMAAELKKTMIDSCMEPTMRETDWECVMQAKTDPEFKRCLQ